MSLTETTIILVIFCSLFYYGVCRATIIEHTLVKSIKTKNGQVYNCIPFHRQLAFNHPLIKFEAAKNIAEIQGRSQSKFGLEESCPLGTVPFLNDVHTSIQPQWNSFDNAKHHCKAIIRTRAGNAKKFLGTRACLSVYKPKVDESQWSTSRMKLSNGPESIEAGFMVNQAVFNDYEAHLYAKFVVNGKECINTQCPGFVQVHKKIFLGIIPPYYSQIRGRQIEGSVSIEKHQDDGNWWVSMHPIEEKVQIGYWPKNLFTSLAEVASQVEWGGEINNPWAKYPQPEMGSGIVALDDPKISASLANVTVVDQNYQYVLPTDTENESDCPLYYSTLDRGYVDEYWGRVIFFGGPRGYH